MMSRTIASAGFTLEPSREPCCAARGGRQSGLVRRVVKRWPAAVSCARVREADHADVADRLAVGGHGRRCRRWVGSWSAGTRWAVVAQGRYPADVTSRPSAVRKNVPLRACRAGRSARRRRRSGLGRPARGRRGVGLFDRAGAEVMVRLHRPRADDVAGRLGVAAEFAVERLGDQPAARRYPGMLTFARLYEVTSCCSEATTSADAALRIPRIITARPVETDSHESIDRAGRASLLPA